METNNIVPNRRRPVSIQCVSKIVSHTDAAIVVIKSHVSRLKIY